jgi:hypothetical protein
MPLLSFSAVGGLAVALVLFVPTLSSGSAGPEDKPRYTLIVRGLGHSWTTDYRGQGRACDPSRRADMTAMIGGGRSGNLLAPRMRCDSALVVGMNLRDPGEGGFAVEGPRSNPQSSAGWPTCGAKYPFTNSKPDSVWVVVCRFF